MTPENLTMIHNMDHYSNKKFSHVLFWKHNIIMYSKKQ